jgi:Fe-S-cluster containining protein
MISCPKACGKCCKVIILRPRMKLTNRSESSWLLKHLTKISRIEAIKLRPEIKLIKDHSYYKCDYFDYNTNKCLNYNDRIPMCTDFPFYEKTVLDATHFIDLPDCYFVHQIMCLK